MKRIAQVVYQTADEIEERIRQREFDAMRLSSKADEHRKTMQEIARLRIHADAKRGLGGPIRQQA